MCLVRRHQAKIKWSKIWNSYHRWTTAAAYSRRLVYVHCLWTICEISSSKMYVCNLCLCMSLDIWFIALPFCCVFFFLSLSFVLILSVLFYFAVRILHDLLFIAKRKSYTWSSCFFFRLMIYSLLIWDYRRRWKTIVWPKQRLKSIHTIAIAANMLVWLADFPIKQKDQGEP